MFTENCRDGYDEGNWLQPEPFLLMANHAYLRLRGIRLEKQKCLKTDICA